jgi:nucleotide-binding universal stress UspA family protein
MSAYARVIAGTDGSESSFRAVRRAAAICADTGGELIVVCAYRPIEGEDLNRMSDVLGQEAYKVVGTHPAEDNLRAAAEQAKAEGAENVRTMVLQGDAVDALIDTAAKEQADLVVVGNRGLNRLAGRLLGSVPQNVSHRAACDVLIVHTTDGH